MKTTTNIKELKQEGYLCEEGPFTNQQIITAALEMAWATKTAEEDENDVWDAVFDECDMSMRITMNEIENAGNKDELLTEMSI
jgi:hypothetical protein